jgi:hypothetical protein
MRRSRSTSTRIGTSFAVGFPDVSVTDVDLDSQAPPQLFRDSFSNGHRPMPASGATDGHREVAFALRLIARQQELE